MILNKHLFLLDQNTVFLNHGSFGATPLVLLEEQGRWQRRMEENPAMFFRDLPNLMRDVRTALGMYLNQPPSNLVMITNSTYGVNAAIAGINLKPGEEILTTDHEYGACDRAIRFYHERKGVNVRRVHIPMPVPQSKDLTNLVWSGITPNTRVLFLSHITSPTAVQIDVARLIQRAQEKGIVTIVDGSHAPAHLDLDLQSLGADFYTGNCHKWMCTPKGSAFMAVRDGHNIPPLVVSWGYQPEQPTESAFVDLHEFLGTRDPSAFLAVPRAIEWLNEIQWKTERSRCAALQQRGVEMLCSIPGIRPILSHPEEGTLLMGAVILPNGTDAPELQKKLWKKHSIEVVAHEWNKTPVLRFSVHIHTNANDIDALVTAVKEESGGVS